jgi:CelD/BcsL family acetyltransferase involved in cellulose biosynthesis
VSSVHSIERITSAQELSSYQAEWQQLVDSSSGVSVFQTYEWITEWLDCFWKDRPLAFLLVKKNGTPVALAPLLRDESGELWCKRSLVSPVNPHSKHGDLIGPSDGVECLGGLLNFLCSEYGSFRLAFKQSGRDSKWIGSLEALAEEHGLGAVIKGESAVPVVRIEGDWPSYLKSRSKHLRREMRRKLRKLEAAGDVRWSTVTDRAECEAALEDVFEIERHSWKQDTGESFTAEQGLDRLYGNFARRAAERGWLRLHLLHLDSRPIAHIYGFEFKGAYHAVKTSYDQSYQHLSPGVSLFEYALRDAFEQRYQVFDFLGHASRWKNELSNEVRLERNVCFFPKGSVRCRTCKWYRDELKPTVKARLPFLLALRSKLR